MTLGKKRILKQDRKPTTEIRLFGFNDSGEEENTETGIEFPSFGLEAVSMTLGKKRILKLC